MSACSSIALRPLSAVILLALSPTSFGASFTIKDGETVTTQQTLNDNETGTIETGGELSTSGVIAIDAPGDNVNIETNGSITTSGDNAYGIYSRGNNATISNSGNIIGSGKDAVRIVSTGDYATINNSGNISTTSGDNANGIYSIGTDATINNSGSIFTSGIYAYGIRSLGGTINNSGSISTSGAGSYGILSGGNNTTNNSGSISTTGENADGINSNGTDAAINNSGSISTTGERADGIRSTGDNATINNSGLISATGPDSLAISGDLSSDRNTTVNLLSGSQIIGGIDLGQNGSDNDTVNIYSGSASANLSILNTENINLFTPGVVVGDTARAQVITLDPTGESTRGVALAGMTSSIHNVIGQRMAQTTPLKQVQLASLELSPGMYFEEHKPVAWAQVFGGRFDRDAEGGAIAYDHHHVGVNFGYEWDISGHRSGLMGGVVRSKTDTQTASFETEADNYYIGVYANRKTHGLNITGSLIAGYGDHENDRLVVDNLNGFETAKSDFDSWFISPGITLGSAFSVNDRLELRPSVSVNYSMAWLDGYRESGTTNSNLSVDDRKAKALTARAQLAAAYQFDEASEFEFRVGLNSRHTDDDDTKVSIAGSQFKFATAGDESVTGGFAGATLRVADNNNLSLVADIEFGGDRDENYAAGSVSLEYVF
ncbi:autotransporter outer membrane beta-barrel domain-containing protein [Methylophaga sulfidovorans]|uniref:Outer membrane autotransporter barrel domain-containing protein n=1 Tax=Methylophaga sulfidovorans TaxID=45496 RepID=A0A1I3U0W5_9GAMM|nr:autotransporter outer membrane beta-barrel domain-containing protein [Methylophaga sulfidovorans]SFJ77188.1 outer membrane autotransporter barrel domain-containing protein [Methylophaga sulfidovorans]